MIVFDLQWDAAHRFEAWFASSTDYESQQARGLIACPLCDSKAVVKAAMAPAVPAKGNQSDRGTARLLAMQRELEAGSQWVGPRLAEEARALHERGETSPIHGEASLEDARALIDEGIPVLPLPFKPIAKSDA